VREDVFCCATKACCSKFRVGNQGPTTRWDSDGPNGLNTAPNSETILVDWWTTGDNWSVYRGGKKGNGKTTTAKKEQTWKMLSQRIADAGITVSRNAKAVGAKIARMEGEYKKAFDFVTNTGQGLMDEGKDITEIVKKMCPYYYELDPIMGSRASTRPLELFDSAGIADDVSSDSAAKDDDANDEDYMDDAHDLNEGDDEVSSVGAENSYVKERNNKKKSPLSLTKKKTTKMHPAVELLSNLSTAVEKAAAQKADKVALELEVKAKELAFSKSRAETDAMLKSRELDMMEKKIELENEKIAVEVNMLKLQEKEQLLLTRKRLMDAGVAMAEIDSILPVKK
jgi:hypothetical protein